MDADSEYGTRPDTEFIPATVGTFPKSDDWELVAAAKNIKALDRRWSKKHQVFKEADARTAAEGDE